ncbi:MAG: hypothetical protein PVG39_22120 [Desulfobacteraceae bacterium]
MSHLLEACKKAYRKHWLGDETIGWNELGTVLMDALCNEMGDDEFCKWLDFEKNKILYSGNQSGANKPITQ